MSPAVWDERDVVRETTPDHILHVGGARGEEVGGRVDLFVAGVPLVVDDFVVGRVREGVDEVGVGVTAQGRETISKEGEVYGGWL